MAKADKCHLGKRPDRFLRIRSQRNFKINAELFERVGCDAREHGTLFVVECHFGCVDVCSAGWRLDVRRIVPDSRSNVEPNASIEVESLEMFRAHIVANVSSCQQHDVRSTFCGWEEHLPTVRVIVGITDKDVVARSFRQQFSVRQANLERYADAQVVTIKDVTDPMHPELAFRWQLIAHTTKSREFLANSSL